QLDNPVPASGRDKATLASIYNLRRAVKGGKRTIKMFRAVPSDVKEGSFRNGDWVTPSREYAERHIGLQDWQDGRIIEQEVPVDDIWWNGDDINEWGYDNGHGEVYKNTENNRKSDELITRDESGRLILPSERFDESKHDVRFSRVFGGNRGYVGYSKSRRAVDAERRGLRSKSQMDKSFAEEVNGILRERGAEEVSLSKIKKALGDIRADEWHHTSKFGNRTDYYSAETVADHFTPEEEVPDVRSERDIREERRRVMDDYIYEHLPTEDVETRIGEKKAYKTREGLYVEVTHSLVGPDGNVRDLNEDGRLIAAGKLSGEGNGVIVDGTDDWYYEHREEFQRAMEEYAEAVEKVRKEYLEREDATDVPGTTDIPGATDIPGSAAREVATESQQTEQKRSAKERREREAYAQRQWRRAHDVARETIEKLNIADDVTVYDYIDEVPGAEKMSAKQRRGKGWYDPKTGKIVIVLGNHRSPQDVMQTVLHEGVAHYGLRKLFGKNFDTFLDNVYQHAEEDVRRRIVELAMKKGFDFREATEEYLASLAEDTDFENADARSWAGHWFNTIKQLFLQMLHKIGLRDYDGVSLSDNELRYILWRSYKNLSEPGHYRNFFSIAEDIVMQDKMQVGNYAAQTEPIMEETMQTAESGLMFRDGDFTPRDRTIARDEYERMVSSGGYQFQEAVQDSMLGLKRLYQAVLGKKTHIEDVAGFENAYLAENRMSSVNAAEQHEYYVRYMKPLLDAIGKTAGSNTAKRQELTDYLMAKHGLERNEVMAQRDFDAYQQQYPSGTKSLADFRERDYAGLTALTGEDDVVMAEQLAQQMVDDYERDNETTELWQRINEATAATLAKIYNSGLLSKERYEKIRDMFEYYIPLQGWDETTSDEVYGYLTSKNGPLGGSPIKHAKGRSSKADDPIATIAMMADDAIRQGNRNKMKQTFLNFVLNHQSDLVSVNDLWLQYNAVSDEWEPVFADIENGDTAADVERKVNAFEERMEQLAESDPDNYKRGRDAQNIPYKVVKG
ncbi:MAG: hypothetical protein IJV55_05105, partial [Paludibacteraceae bacterium]|nr:hypothetical protein [Paludibacteraceae bacterium]